VCVCVCDLRGGRRRRKGRRISTRIHREGREARRGCTEREGGGGRRKAKSRKRMCVCV
jgi:hypothetical protein